MNNNMAFLAAGILGAFVGLASTRGKTQGIRVLDVLAVGPLIITAGLSPQTDTAFRMALIFTGAATVTFNGRNFLAQQMAERNA